MEKRTFSKTFSLTFQEWDQIQQIMDKHGSLSPSETIRNIVRVSFQKEFPDYIYNRSATDVAKRALLEKNNDVEELSDLDYIRKYLPGGLFFQGKNTLSQENEKYYLLWDEQGLIRPWKLSTAKKYFASQKNHVNAHREKVKSVSVSEGLDQAMCKTLKDLWGVDVPEFYTEV